LTGVLLALGASVAWGLGDFGGGLGARRVALPFVLLVSQATGLLLIALVVAASGEAVPPASSFAWGVLAGAFGVLGLAAFYRALAVGTMGIVGPISATASIVPIVFGLARGEHPSALQATGVVLAFCGVVAASLEVSPAGEGPRVGAGVGLALAAALGFGWSLLALNRAAQGGELWAPLTMRATAVPLVALAVLVLRPRRRGLRPNLPLLAGAGAADTSANVLYSLAATRGLISVVSVLASLYPVVLVVLGRIVLRERIARQQLAGVATALAGVALISAAG